MQDNPEKGPQKPQNEESSVAEVFSDFAKDALGYDKGLLKTLIDLYKRPASVVDGYLSKSPDYVSPFKIVFSIATIWILVMNFIFDWEQIGRDVFQQIATLAESLKSDTSLDSFKDPEFVSAQENYGKFFGDLFSKYLILIAVIVIPLNALLSLKLCKKFSISFQRHLAVTAYQVGLKILPGFIFVLGFSLNYLITIGLVILIIILGALGWKPAGYLTSPVAIRKFFHENGEVIEKKYNQAALLIIIFSMISGLFVGFLINM